VSLTKICQTVISLTFSLMSQFHTDSVVFVAISFCSCSCFIATCILGAWSIPLTGPHKTGLCYGMVSWAAYF